MRCERTHYSTGPAESLTAEFKQDDGVVFVIHLLYTFAGAAMRLEIAEHPNGRQSYVVSGPSGSLTKGMFKALSDAALAGGLGAVLEAMKWEEVTAKTVPEKADL
jgi:hypothetical protein